MTSPDILEQVRHTCRAVANGAPDVHINEEAIDAFIKNIDQTLFEKLSQEISPMPLKFENFVSELNFIAVLNLLNFGSGYRKELHKINGRGAFDTMRFGVMGAYLSGASLNAHWMSQISLNEVSSLFELPLMEFKEIQPGIQKAEPSELKPLAEKIVAVLHETGHILSQIGAASLGSAIVHTLSSQTVPSASLLVKYLVETFPAFRDVHTYQQEKIYILKKAQISVADIYRRFYLEEKLVNFEDYAQLTIFADNVVPAVLNHNNILVYSQTLKNIIDCGENIGMDSGFDVQLRATAVDAGEKIIQKCRNDNSVPSFLKTITGAQLDLYLWRLGKEETYRNLERQILKNTIFY